MSPRTKIHEIRWALREIPAMLVTPYPYRFLAPVQTQHPSGASLRWTFDQNQHSAVSLVFLLAPFNSSPEITRRMVVTVRPYFSARAEASTPESCSVRICEISRRVSFWRFLDTTLCYHGRLQDAKRQARSGSGESNSACSGIVVVIEVSRVSRIERCWRVPARTRTGKIPQ